MSGRSLSLSMFFGLVFLVVAAPVVSRCMALRMPTVRLVKGRRLSSQGAVETWKARVDGSENMNAEQGEAAGVIPSRTQEAWWRILFVLASLSLPATSIATVRNLTRRCGDLFSQQFSPAGNPLRC